jgi:hypothetical protein
MFVRLCQRIHAIYTDGYDSCYLLSQKWVYLAIMFKGVYKQLPFGSRDLFIHHLQTLHPPFYLISAFISSVQTSNSGDADLWALHS